MKTSFPPLNLNDWQPTRDTLHTFSRALGKIRGALTPPHPHWWHASLRVNDAGLTTTPIPTDTGNPFTLQLDFTAHTLVFIPPAGKPVELPLENQSPQSFLQWILDRLDSFGIEPEINRTPFDDAAPLPYDPVHAETFFRALHRINKIFVEFRNSLSGETSPVQLWSHHFDLSLVWFSGRKVNAAPGEEGDPEQIGFGFSTGDEGIAEPYFYANPWLPPAGIFDTPLPSGAQWHTEGWQGGLLLYRTVAAAPQSDIALLDFLRAVQQNSSKLMHD